MWIPFPSITDVPICPAPAVGAQTPLFKKTMCNGSDVLRGVLVQAL